MLIDLVLVKHNGASRNYLFRAPSNSGIEVGEDLMLRTRIGLSTGQAKKVCPSVDDETDIYKFILACAGATHPLSKVASRVIEEPLDYSAENATENTDLNEGDTEVTGENNDSSDTTDAVEALL